MMSDFGFCARRAGAILCTGFLTAILAACSSGGGNGGGGGNPKNPPPLPAPVEYTGKTTPATIGRENAGLVAFGFLRVMREAYPAAILTDATLQSIEILDYEIYSGNGECESGSIAIVDHRPLNEINGEIDVAINDCVGTSVLGFKETAFGKIEYELSDGENGLPQHESYMPYLSIESSTDLLEFTSSATATYSAITIKSAVMRSERLQQSFKVENFVQNESTGKGAGRLFIGDLGYVDVEYDRTADQLLLKGDQGTSLKFTYKMGTTASGEDVVSDVRLTLNDPAEPFSPLESRVEASTLLSYLIYVPNAAPEAPEQPVFNVNRTESIALNANHVADSNFDFLTFSWQLETQRDDCDFEIAQTANRDAIFRSECTGDFEVVARVDDGRGMMGTAKFLVRVLPLAAEFSTIPPVTLSDGQEIDLQLSPINQSEDGPFQYTAAYLPNGVSISQDGRVTGRPLPLVAGGDHSFKLGITVDNGKRTLVELDFTLAEPENTFSLYTGDIQCDAPQNDWWDIDLDGKPELICEYLRTYAIVEVSEGIQRVDSVGLTPARLEEPAALNFSQYDLSPSHEIVIAYAEETAIIDGQSHEIKTMVRHPLPSLRDIQLFPSVDGKPGFFLMGKEMNTTHFYFYDSIAMNFVELPPNSALQRFHQVRYLPQQQDVAAIFSQLLARDSTGNSQIADVDGDGDGDWVELVTTDNANIKVTAVDLISGAPVAYPNQIDPNFRMVRAFFTNMDTDAKDELVAAEAGSEHLAVFDWTDAGIVQTMLELPNGCQMSVPGLKRVRESVARLFMVSTFSTNLDLCAVGQSLSIDPVKPEVTFPPRQTYPIAAGVFDVSGNVNTYLHDTSSYPANTVKMVFAPDGSRISATRKGVDLWSPYLSPTISYDRNTGSPESLFFFSHTKTLSQYDFDSFMLLGSVSAPETNLTEGRLVLDDLNLDEIDDVLAIGTEPTVSVIDWQEKSTYMIPRPPGQFITAADFEDDGRLEYVFAAGSPLDLTIYHASETGFTSVASYATKLSLAPSEAVVGIQDIDDDGIMELILSGRNWDCSGGRTVPLVILDSNLTPIYDGQHSSCIKGIPNMPNARPKKNLIVYSAVAPTTIRSTSSDTAFNALVEIGFPGLEVVWTSRSFIGLLMQDSFSSSVGNPYGSTKTMATQAGLYIFE